MISRSALVKPSLAFFNEEERFEVFRHTPLHGLTQRFAPIKPHNDAKRKR